MSRVRFVLALTWLMPACTLLPPVDYHRMIVQDRFTVWQPAPFFADGRAMRTPPEGTLPRDAPVGDPPVNEGILGDRYVGDVPLPVTPALLAEGRARFETYCAASPGLGGDGESVVARNMDLRPPPAIAGPAARGLPPGRIYQVIDHGYGLMRSYAEDLITPEERWSVVAYLMALSLSHGVSLGELPEPARHAAEAALR